MPTLKPLILKHQRKDDGTYGVKIRITHNRETKYFTTPYYVSDRQLTNKQVIKDRELIKKLNETVDELWEVIRNIPNVEALSVGDLVQAVEREKSKRTHVAVDFISFSQEHIQGLAQSGRKNYAYSFKTTLNSLCDYLQRDTLPVEELTAKFLNDYLQYLKTERSITRLNQFGKPTTTVQEGLENGAKTYLTNIRTLFNAARSKYNDEDQGIVRIKHYPFQKFKVGRKAPTEKRNITPDAIKSIMSFNEERQSRASLARDIFMLSFYLVGMNVIDLYEATVLAEGRIIYNRKKTEDRRDDGALISIKIEPEAQSLIDLYKDPTGKRVFRFYKMYATSENFVTAVNKGLKIVSDKLNLGKNLTSYYARHSWATIARNICHIPKEDIAMALNHSDPTHRITDTYLATDWTIIDRANRKVLSTLKKPVYKSGVEDVTEFFEDGTIKSVLEEDSENKQELLRGVFNL